MSNVKHIALGAASLMPLASLCILHVSYVSAGSIAGMPVEALALAAGAQLMGLGLWSYYVGWLIGHPALRTSRKALWVVLLSAAGVLTLPVFWLLYFRPAIARTLETATA